MTSGSYTHTEEQRKQISDATKKAMQRPEVKQKILGANNSQWKGDNVGYMPLHWWIRTHKPKTGQCENCKKITQKLDCANISGNYKRDFNDYEWLCRSCHMKKDGRINNLKQFCGAKN